MKKILAPILIGLSLLLSLAGLLGLSSGDTAPDFSAKNQDGKLIKLSELHGKPVLLYFYPKDDTPGCTKEACNFRDRHGQLLKLGAVIFGISRQDEKSHQEFRKKFHLPFDLLIDDKGEIAKKYGIGTMPVVGFHHRQSVLIGADGKIAKVYSKVDPDHHPDEVLKDLEELSKKK